MTPSVYDLQVHRGDTAQWQFLLWEDAPGGTPVDLTGAAVAAEIRDRPGGSTIISTIVTVTLPNRVDIEFPVSEWDRMPNSGAWDLEVDWGLGTEVDTFVRGRVVILTTATVTQDLTLYHNDSASWQVVVWEDAGHSVPFDLTGTTVTCEIRDSPGGSLIVPLTSVVHDTNIVDVTLPMAQWPRMPLSGVWSMRMTDTGGEVRTMVTGRVTVTMDVTHSTPVGP